MSQPPFPAQPYPHQPYLHRPESAEVTRPGRSYRPAGGLAAAALSVAGLWTLVDVVEAVTAWAAAETYAQGARHGWSVNEIYVVYYIANFGWFVMSIAAYVVGCLLLWRLRENAEALVGYPHARAAGWVWGGWLVPVVALWFPYQVVRDIRAATEPPGARGLVGWWWALWLVSTVTAMVSSNIVPTSGRVSAETARTLGQVEALNVVVVAVSFALWCGVVHRILTEQDRWAAGRR